MNDAAIGMSKVEKYYEDYGYRARELAAQGRTIIGYVCSFVPLEFITAAGCIPFRIRGDVHEPITKGDTLLETIVCPYYRSCFDLGLKGKYSFLSGTVVPHGCDSMVRSYSAWSYSLNMPYAHFVNIPSVVEASSFEFFNEELKTFKKSLEDFTGKTVTEADLLEAIRLHNTLREKIRTLYGLRKQDPPLISGTDLTKVVTAASSLPADEAIALLEEVLDEMGRREKSPLKKGARILVDGACIDNAELIQLIEDLGANVVADTICNGARDSWPRVRLNGDPIDALSHRYLDAVNCPKTYRQNKAGTFEGDIQARFRDIGFMAEEFAVEGAILYVYKFCDPFGFEVPARKAYYESIGVPLLHLEDLYSGGTIGQLRTRIQAFLEMIE
jgi:benzoyl-CoA reductase/2-hydroxyglutaryl-CoA dehydratase subunit BcrC/BadD/HgdB